MSDTFHYVLLMTPVMSRQATNEAALVVTGGDQ
jgi:hypothetical protein